MKCQECGYQAKSFKGLSTHIQHHHNKKDYYDKYMKKEGEGECKVCKKPTNFTILGRGYEKFCCKECERIDYSTRMTESNPMKTESAQQNQRNTNLERYGVEHNWQIPKVKVESKKKFRKTCKERYGVENPLQNRKIFDKKCKTGKLIKKFRNTDLWYQASYELNFLENFYDKFKIQRGPTLKYRMNGAEHFYFSDFLIPELNIIVEIKGSYYEKIHKKAVKLKKQSAIDNGYDYIMIVDKDYSDFISLSSGIL